MKSIYLTGLVMLFVATASGQWQLEERISANPAASETCINNARCIAASGDYVHITWFDERDGNWEVYYRRSDDMGHSFEPEWRMTGSPEYSRYASVAVAGTMVYLIWLDFRDNEPAIYYKVSENYGVNWSTDLRLTDGTYIPGSPACAAYGNTLHVVWKDSRDNNAEIYHIRSTDKGQTWQPAQRLTDRAGVSANPSVSADASRVHLLWTDNYSGNDEIYYRGSSDGGQTWDAEVPVTSMPGASLYPNISSSDLAVAAIWSDTRDRNEEVYYAVSTDGGLTWGANTRLTSSAGASTYPSVYVSGSLVHAAWREYIEGKLRIYYNRSGNTGASWDGEVLISDGSVDATTPSAVAAGEAVHVVWNDLRDVAGEVYYRRNITGNILGMESTDGSRLNLSVRPNPCSGPAKVTWENREPMHQRLSLYDTRGILIAVLADGVLDAGRNEAVLDCAGLPAGLYALRLESGGTTELCKFVKMK